MSTHHAPPPTRREREEALEEGLQAIYGAPTEQDAQDLAILDRETGNPITRWLLRILLVLCATSALAWGGFFLWNRFAIESAQPLVTSIEGPERVRAGELAVYTIRYKNEQQVPLAALSLHISLPPGFSLDEAIPQPTDADGLSWTLGSLTPGSDGSVELHGRFRSAVPSSETIQARFDYRPANFSSEFQDIATTSVSVDRSPIDIGVTGPDKALPGDEVSYTIELLNTSSQTQQRLELSATLPVAFDVTRTEPPTADPEQVRWIFDEIATGETKAVTVFGRYTGSGEGTQGFSATVAYQAATGGVRLPLAQAGTETDLLGGELDVHLVVNGSTQDRDVRLGDKLTVSFDYNNSGREVIDGVYFTLETTGVNGKAAPIEWAGVKGLPAGMTPGPIMNFDEHGIPDITTLVPGASGVVDLTIPLLARIDPTSMADELTLTLTAHISRVGSVESPRAIPLSGIRVTVGSDLRATAQARYYDDEGQPLGSGPLPPQVGETTKYRIVWHAENTLHPLRGFRMTANLPPDVAWTNQTQSDGTIRFDETTRMVIWDLPEWTANRTVANASFEVAIVPKASDVGGFFKLTNATSVEATDATHDSRISQSIDSLTSELPDDATAKDVGIVTE